MDRSAIRVLKKRRTGVDRDVSSVLITISTRQYGMALIASLARTIIQVHRTGMTRGASRSVLRIGHTGIKKNTSALRASITISIRLYGTVPRASRARTIIKALRTGKGHNA